MDKYVFRGKEVSCNSYWIDDRGFVFDFGDGELMDKDGDFYFVHCIYDTLLKDFIFEVCWEHDCVVVSADIYDWSDWLTDDEMENVKEHILNMLK